MAKSKYTQTTPITVEEVTEGHMGPGTRETHPSYGMISISRLSSSTKTTLFGSDAGHNHLVAVRIRPNAERVRSLSHDWYFAEGGAETEVWMSEAQFAQMITSLNMGDGVPCTIRRMNEGILPLPEDGKPVIERFAGEAEDRVKGAVDNLKKATTTVGDLLDGKAKPNKGTLEELKRRLDWASADLTRNQQYLVNQLQERLEGMYAEAMAEFEAHMNHSLKQRGLESVTQQQPQLGTTIEGDYGSTK